MNEQIKKLEKLQTRARMLANLRYANENKWEKAFEKASQTPEWKAYCAQTGSVTNYNYGDVIC